MLGIMVVVIIVLYVFAVFETYQRRKRGEALEEDESAWRSLVYFAEKIDAYVKRRKQKKEEK